VNVLVATVGAAGLVLLYSGLTRPPPPGSGRFGRALERLVHAAGSHRLTVRRLVLIVAAGACLGFIFGAGASSSATIGAAFGVAGAALPVMWVRGRGLRRRRLHREAWPDALATLIAGVRAGVSLPEAVAALAVRGPADLRDGFRAFESSYRASGSFAVALARLRSALADPVADRVVAALTLVEQVGGTDLVRVLRTTADFVREDVRVRKEIEARWSWTVVAAKLAASAPWIVLFLMSTKPEAARAYDTSAGAAVIFGGAVATIVGYRLMLRAARLPEERRLR
jgi:tight adherence protein B